MKKKPLVLNNKIEISACMVELNGTVPTEIKLTPSGTFRAKDGRPHGISGWSVTSLNSQSIIDSVASLRDQVLIDYEHQTLYSRENGKPSPAAGWFKNIEYRENDGLYATDVEWTEAAKSAIQDKEYRYISPVLTFDKTTGEVTSILMAALVNYPALDGLNDLAAAHFNFNTTKENPMNKELLALLGLSMDADDGAVLSAVKALQTKQATQVEQVTALSAEIVALKDKAPDSAKYVPVAVVTELQTQLAALSTGIEDGKIEKLIASNLTKLPTESLQKWAATQSLESLSAYLENAPEVSALGAMQSGGKTPDAQDENGLTADEVAVCAATGISVEDFKKSKGEK